MYDLSISVCIRHWTVYTNLSHFLVKHFTTGAFIYLYMYIQAQAIRMSFTKAHFRSFLPSGSSSTNRCRKCTPIKFLDFSNSSTPRSAALKEACCSLQPFSFPSTFTTCSYLFFWPVSKCPTHLSPSPFHFRRGLSAFLNLASLAGQVQ